MSPTWWSASLTTVGAAQSSDATSYERVASLFD